MNKEALKLALEALVNTDSEPSSKSWKREIEAITAVKRALANEALEKMAENARELGLDYEPPQPEHGWTPERIAGMARLKEAQDKKLAQPEFIKHEVKNDDDWSEWVCPDPKNYLMKCCDCGLVHEAQFGVVRYKSETERDDCDIVDDPNLQAVFRMRRSEEWTPEDIAHRAGGLPIAQPEQKPVAIYRAGQAKGEVFHVQFLEAIDADEVLFYTKPQEFNLLTDDEIVLISADCATSHQHMDIQFARAIESKLKEKNVVC